MFVRSAFAVVLAIAALEGSAVMFEPAVGVRTSNMEVSELSGTYRVCFEARRLANVDQACHWGFAFHDVTGRRFFAWVQPNTSFMCEITDADGRKLTDGHGDGLPFEVKDGADYRWVSVRLDVCGQRYRLTLDGENCLSGRCDLSGIRDFQFHAYNMGAEMRNFSVEAIPSERLTPGTVIGWMRPGEMTDAVKLLGRGGESLAKFALYKHDFARAEILKSGDTAGVLYTRWVSLMKARTDEWFHYAFIWTEDGRAVLCVNGDPFLTGTFENMKDPIMGFSLNAAERIECGELAKDFRFDRRALRLHEVIGEYRRIMPVDVVVADSIVPAGIRTNVMYRIAPGGYYRRPNPVEGLANSCATVGVSSAISRMMPIRGDQSDPARISDWKVEPVEGGTAAERLVEVLDVVEVPSAEIALPPGDYRLTVAVRNGEVRHTECVFFTASAPIDPNPFSKEGWKRGALLLERRFARPEDVDFKSCPVSGRETAIGSYIEVGSHVGDRFAAVLTLPERKFDGPCELEIEWPDDRERVMELYMFERLPNSCRDHLQQGLIAGGIVPNSGRMRKTRYLYYPTSRENLFEMRTTVAGRPAAVSAVRLYEIDGPLPRLKIHHPEGLPARTFGHCDEDQTFDNNLTSARMASPTHEVLRRIVDYFGYTGQSALHYSTHRYAELFSTPRSGACESGLFPRRQGELPGVVRTLANAGIEFVPQAYFWTDPAVENLDRIEWRDPKDGHELLDLEGHSVRQPFKRFACIANPAEQERFLSLLSDDLGDLLRVGTGRVAVCLDNRIAAPFSWPGLKAGYDDWTVRRFAADTGVVLPEATGKDRFRVRYDFLTAPGMRDRWLKWRSGITMEFFGRFCQKLRQAKADVRIIAEVTDDFERAYAEYGVDVRALAKMPNVELSVIRHNTAYWYQLFRGAEEPDDLERLYDLNGGLARIREVSGGSIPQVYTYPEYFETFEHPLGGDARFGNYFQNADVKPNGRHWLREPAFAVAAADALNYAIGMQPLGTWGVETEAREFAQAYCALPAIPFTDMAGSRDPVIGRYLQTTNGVYFYVVNMHHTPHRAILSFGLDRTPTFVDLSTDVQMSTNLITLNAYQLRSFLIPNAENTSAIADRMSLDIQPSRLSKTCYDDREREIREALAAFEREGLDCESARKVFKSARDAVRTGRLAEAHRLYFSRPLNGFLAKNQQMKWVLKECEMNRNGRWAVNCGCSDYTVVGGKLFSPDRSWDEVSYGRFGEKKLTASRDVSMMRGDESFRELYATEAYDVDGYRFRVPRGRYRVHLFLKWGFKPSFKKGALKVDYKVNGKSISGAVDFFVAQKGKFGNVADVVAETEVGKDGVLEIVLEDAGHSDGSCRLLNGIEITEIKK